ncbi:hypothetical protein CM19_07030 [Candidatus Acidianus copahuensis]|uniref:Uncharacterized protein n=1 Tax=Candidatus Acidianus copahuensis TaxID=1160895 RepID=A0A031LM13_9CREN|nr:hypothetical protein [Candidatus Acidianus copahuensis]EZQ06693.1 hypothetical protein CM19_07030 [Candidatus Acidianus copahuensis]
MSINSVNYEVIKITEGRYRLKVGQEDVLIKTFPVILNVFETPDKETSFSVNVVVSVDSQQKKFGTLCNPSMINHPPVEVEIIERRDAEVLLKVNDKERKVKIIATNISIYPEYRDNLGNPCTAVNWVIAY